MCGVDVDALSERGDLVITISKGHCFNPLDFFHVYTEIKKFSMFFNLVNLGLLGIYTKREKFSKLFNLVNLGLLRKFTKIKSLRNIVDLQ